MSNEEYNIEMKERSVVSQSQSHTGIQVCFTHTHTHVCHTDTAQDTHRESERER